MLYYLAYFFGGAFLTNSVPHLVNGMSGRLFPTPFATPPGRGESSSTLNVLWGAINVVLGYVLIFRVGAFSLLLSSNALAAGLGAFAMATYLSWHFGRLYGGSRSVPRSGP